MLQIAPSPQTIIVPSRPKIWLSLLMLTAVIASTLAVAWPSLAFQKVGQTSVYFEKRAALGARPASVWPAPNAKPLSAVDITIWFLSDQETFNAQDIFAQRLERGQTPAGQLAYFIDFDEAGLTQYLNYWFGAWAQDYLNFRNAQVDLKPGGLIIYGDVNLGTHWQRLGAVFNLDETGRRFTFVGVDMDGQLLAAPPAGPIATAVEALAANGNRALQDLKFIDPSGTLIIQQIILTEDQAQIIAH